MDTADRRRWQAETEQVAAMIGRREAMRASPAQRERAASLLAEIIALRDRTRWSPQRRRWQEHFDADPAWSRRYYEIKMAAREGQSKHLGQRSPAHVELAENLPIDDYDRHLLLWRDTWHLHHDHLASQLADLTALLAQTRGDNLALAQRLGQTYRWERRPAPDKPPLEPPRAPGSVAEPIGGAPSSAFAAAAADDIWDLWRECVFLDAQIAVTGTELTDARAANAQLRALAGPHTTEQRARAPRAPSEAVPGPSPAGAAIAPGWPPSAGLWTAEPFDDADPVDPCHPHSYLGKATSWAEQVMRADFARFYQLIHTTVSTYTELDALGERADRIAARWRDRDDHLGRAWNHAEDNLPIWRHTPESMHTLLASVRADIAETGTAPIPPIEIRNLLHTRELTGNGDWPTAQTGTPAPNIAGPHAIATCITEAVAVRPGHLETPPPEAIPIAVRHDTEQGPHL